MIDKKTINNFFINDGVNIVKQEGRKAPTITKEIREINGTKNGKSLELVNCKAYKLLIDNEVYQQKDFRKLFPNRYSPFNIKVTFRNKEAKEKACFEEVLYFYFPIQMLKEHNIKVVCRKRMLEITYIL